MRSLSIGLAFAALAAFPAMADEAQQAAVQEAYTEFTEAAQTAGAENAVQTDGAAAGSVSGDAAAADMAGSAGAQGGNAESEQSTETAQSAETSGTEAAAAAEAQPQRNIRAEIVAFAKQFVGRPYRYGGSSLTNGTDCSGFTMRVLQNFGIGVGRDSRTQASQARRISVNEVQPGDLLFYASGKRINHVAMYIGDGLIVHASNSRTGITVSSAFYRTPYMAGTYL